MNKDKLPKKKSAPGQEPVCYCFEVYETEIVDIIHKHGIADLETLQTHTEAGQGCKSCTFDLEDIIRREGPDVKVVSKVKVVRPQ